MTIKLIEAIGLISLTVGYPHIHLSDSYLVKPILHEAVSD